MSERTYNGRILVRIVKISPILWMLPRYPKEQQNLTLEAGEPVNGLSSCILPDLHGAWVQLLLTRPHNKSGWKQTLTLSTWSGACFKKYIGCELPFIHKSIWYRLASRPETIPEGW